MESKFKEGQRVKLIEAPDGVVNTKGYIGRIATIVRTSDKDNEYYRVCVDEYNSHYWVKENQMHLLPINLTAKETQEKIEEAYNKQNES